MQDSTQDMNTPETIPPRKRFGMIFVKEVLKFFILVLIVVVPVRLFVAQPFIVEGDSMQPTFASNNYLIVDELSYHLRSPARGEVVVLHDPRNAAMFLIKRVIGLPGETVEILNGKVSIKNTEHPDGLALDEPYISAPESDDHLSITLSQGQYFVMGDNRPYSLDSRELGPVSKNQIVGRAFARLLPITEAALLPGYYKE